MEELKKVNNLASNLEWCDNTYNSQYPNDLGVYCFDLDEYFKSASDAAVHTGICRSSIVKACRGQLSQAGGKLWCYSKDKPKSFPLVCSVCVYFTPRAYALKTPDLFRLMMRLFLILF